MAEEGLGGSCDWTNKSCEQLLLQPPPDSGYQMEDVPQSAVETDGAGHLPSCLQVEMSAHVKGASLDAAGQGMFDGTSVVDSAITVSDPRGLCTQLAGTMTQELPNHAPSESKGQPVRGSMCGSAATVGDVENGSQANGENLPCPVCHSEYKSASELKEHFKSHVQPRQAFSCWEDGCHFTTQDRRRFQAHLRREHSVKAVTCSQRACRLLFPSREEMSLHYRSHYPFHCNRCDFVSSNSKLFSQHRKDHPGDGEMRLGGETLQPTSNEPERQELSQQVLQSDGDADRESVSLCEDGRSRLRKRRRVVAQERECENAESSSEEEEETESEPTLKAKIVGAKSPRTAKNKTFKGDVEDGKEHLFKTHMCPECKRCFKKRTHLAEHLHLHFPDPSLQCPNCHKFFTSRSKLKIHMMRESGEKTHRCPLCDYSSVEKNALNRHMASIHEGVSNFYSDTYSCPACQETFKLSQALKEHMKGHKEEQKMLLCFHQGCDRALSDRKEFLRHLKESHGVRAVECRYHACSLLFGSREEMEQHRKNHYAFHCQDCNFVCSNKHSFRKHKKRGHPGTEELPCRFCPYKSFNPVEFADHVGKMHANEKIHHCGDCDFATAHKRVLIRHMLLHTGEKPHKCSLCDFTCRDISYLSKHMLTHSSDKNYMCTECGYITKWKHYLNVHMRKHSGDLRYQCNQCSYRCHRADQLSSHKLRHQGKNLICEVCGFGCKRKYELQKHMQAKHSQSCQLPMYQCQHCSYQTKYKQALLNHENCKHTKHREFRCALCPYRTFSNTSLFFHKRKSHGYVPGDKDWLERYASKQQEISECDLLLPYKAGGYGRSAVKPSPSGFRQIQKLKPVELDSQEQGSSDGGVSGCLHDSVLVEPAGDPNGSVMDESLLATITLEPVESCSIDMEDFPVRLELLAPAELLSKELSAGTLGTCEDPLPARGEMLCCSEALTVEDNVNCGQDFEEETSPHSEDQDRPENGVGATSVQYNQEPMLCDLHDKCEELTVTVSANMELQSEDIPMEVQESWGDVVKNGVPLTIVCESNGLSHNDLPGVETSTLSQDEAEESCRPESVLKALRKQDKEQAETLVLEGRVQMLVVQSNTPVYKCEKCSYITRKEGSMLQHSKTGCHGRKTPLVCVECGASFKQQRGLNTHLLKKCPATLKRNRASLRPTSSAEPTGGPEVANNILLLENCPEDDGPGTEASSEGIIPESHGSNGSEDFVEQLSPCQELIMKTFKETIQEEVVKLNSGEAKTRFSSVPSGEGMDAGVMPAEYQDSEKYRFEQGKFRCRLCSFSCSRECTISCHVKESCRELKRIPCVLCPTVLRSEAALRKHRRVKHGEMQPGGGKDQGSDSSEDKESQNTEEDGDRADDDEAVFKPNNDTPNGSRLSCPTCPFTCSQERAMRTHRKKGCLKPGELQCHLCSFRCMSPTALKHHRGLHQKYTCNRVPLQCKQCDFTCKQPRCMKQHVRIRHEGIKPHHCQYCDFSTTRRYRLDAHESLHTGVGRISCSACGRTFGTNSKLRLHRLRVHEKNPTHFCGLCDYSGYSQNDIARHMSSCHSGEPAFPCSVCQASFSSEAALKQHSLRKHQEKATHDCSRCLFSCHSLATLRCHLQKQHPQLECGICKEAFSRRQDLEEHRKSHFAHHCQQCQYASKDRQQLVCHYSEEHETSAVPGTEGDGGEGTLRCPFCAFTCHHQLVYDHHVKGHGGTRVYKCSDCEYSTRNKQKITWHSRIHTGEKPYKCHLCTYACADPSRLKYHMRIHKDEKKYLCPDCGYKCKWVNQLKYHMTKHTGLKPHQCEECDYCTNRADALRVHRETRHREVRSFICEQCGKAFKTRFLLKTHLKKHSEEKPYVCSVCQRGFRWPAGLRHHYLTHTNQHPFFCRYCSYRAKQKFQVVKHIQRHHADIPDTTEGVGKEPFSFSVHPQVPGDVALHQTQEGGTAPQA
ncbi:zinc finger protein 142 isoform X2 [Ascaphus truei]|uniref:zinc finger protein 142 isoform X2 n=1 Tax=Ascaphus truei TaxID=8439 RepID=UPI003F5A75DC